MIEMPDERWEKWLREQVAKKNIVLEVKERIDLRKYVPTIKALLTVEIIIGLLAIFLMYYKFGSDKLVETLLSWTIGVTIVTTIVTGIIGKYGKFRF